MHGDNIKEIKEKAEKVYKLLDFIFYGTIIFFVILLVFNIVVGFMPVENFEAIKGVRQWSLTVHVTTNHSLSISVPFTILQPVSGDMINAKSAYLTFSFSYIMTLFPALMFGIRQLRDILFSTVNDETPFTLENIGAFKHIAYVVIAYSLVVKPLRSILGCIFVTKIFSLTVDIPIEGILVGILVLILSEIFKYGVYLQYEYDTTL